SALRDRYQHDVHQAYPANTKRERSNEAHQDFQPQGNDFELVDLHHEVEHLHRLVVRLVEFVRHRHNGSDRLFQALVLGNLVVEPDRVQVVRIFQVAHRAEGYVNHAINVGIALLHLGAQNPDDFKAETVHANAFAHRVTPGKQFLLRLRTDQGYPCMLHLVFGVIETALVQFQKTEGRHIRIIARNPKIENPRFKLDMRILADFGTDISDLGKIDGKGINIIESKPEGNSRFLTTRLHGSLSRNYDDQVTAEVGKDVGAGPAKTIAIGKQHDDCRDAPRHPQHGERSTAPVVKHGAVGFLKQIAEHPSLLPERIHRLHNGSFARGIKTGNDSCQRQAANRE